MKVVRKRMSYERKKEWTGLAFISPWLIGVIFFFLKPLIQSLRWSFSTLKIEPSGLNITFAGIRHYRDAFLFDADFVRQLTESVTNMLYQVPVIIVFSLFIAIILNQRFRGRLLMRAVFFLPVIVASGLVIGILRGDVMARAMMSGQSTSILFRITSIREILLQIGLNHDIVTFIFTTVNNIFELSWKSGIQILIFLAGLQTIPSTLYEASAIEGATSWETFWKITFPMISPIILLNLIYSIIDNFTDYSNSLMLTISNTARRLDFEYSSAMAWVYFVVVFIIIGIVYKIVNKRVFYMVD